MNTTRNTNINLITNGDRFWAFANNDTALFDENGKKTEISKNTQVSGSAYYDNDNEIIVHIDNLGSDFICILSSLSYKDWSIYVMTPFKHERNVAT